MLEISKKTKTVTIKKIDDESLQVLFEAYGEIDVDVIIVIDSPGGSVSVAKVMLQLMNDNKDRTRVIASVGIYSSAFYIFFLFRGKKFIAEGCRGMRHKGHIKVHIHDDNSVYFNEDRCIMENNKIIGLRPFGFMTAGEVNLFDSGEDVFFNRSRMLEIFKDVTVISYL